MCICTRGWRNVTINGTPCRLTPGKAHIISPILLTMIVSESDDYEALVIDTETRDFIRVAQHIIPMMAQRGILDHPIFDVSPTLMSFMQEGARHIEELRRTETSEDASLIISHLIPIEIQRLFLHFILEILPQLPERTQQERSEVAIVMNFIIRLQKEYATHREVSYYASFANISTGYFSALVKKTIGHTPSEMIALVTILHAQRLLSDTRLTIKEVAAQLGFPEQFTFRKYFKTHTGISPKEWRRK